MKYLALIALRSKTGLGIATVSSSVALLAVIGLGLGHSESALPPPPANQVWAERDDAGSMALAESNQTLSALDCPECETPFSGYDALLRRLQPRADVFIESTAAYVFDESCGQALYGKNEDKQLPQASLTKMMTALVTVEHVQDLSQTVTVTTSAREMQVTTRSSVMGLEPGSTVTVLELLYGLMLPSGNDAAIELAKFVAGDVESFVGLMNKKAAELGLTSTLFANPHGLDAGGQRSTARELVLLGEAMMADPLLAQIAAAPNYTLPAGLSFKNGNRMLGSYLGAYGVKIGYTGKAAHTIVVAAERDGRRVYASVLGSQVPYVDATSLLDWAFSKPATC